MALNGLDQVLSYITATHRVLLRFSCGLFGGLQRCSVAQHILAVTDLIPELCSSGTTQPFSLYRGHVCWDRASPDSASRIMSVSLQYLGKKKEKKKDFHDPHHHLSTKGQHSPVETKIIANKSLYQIIVLLSTLNSFLGKDEDKLTSWGLPLLKWICWWN